MAEHPRLTCSPAAQSFRHTASFNINTRRQILKLLQQLLGHSNLNTSMTYLRSIGVIQVESSMMPEL